MWFRRPIVSVLLLLAVLPVFLSAPTPHSQTFTTITSLRTITKESTVTTVLTESTTATSHYPVLKVRTAYKTDALVINRVPDTHGCYVWYFDFTAKKNEILATDLTSSIPIGFYVLSDEYFETWRKVGLCDVKGALAGDTLTQEYYHALVIPSDGEYHLILMNYSHGNVARVKFVSQIIGVVFTSRSTRTETYLTTTTQVLTSVWTAEVGFPPQQNILLVGALVVVVVIVTALVVVRMSKRRQTPQSERPRTLQPVQTQLKHCVECGKHLPAGAKSCPDCGTTQPR